MSPKTAILGATSFIGSAIYQGYAARCAHTVGTCRYPNHPVLKYLDFTVPKLADLGLVEAGITEAILMAAQPNVARCETDREQARQLNVTGTLSVIDQLIDLGIRPIFASSDYVFDGIAGMFREEDPANPSTAYGAQKLEVEEALLAKTQGKGLVVRFSKVYSLTKGDGVLLDEMASLLTTGNTVRAAHDQIFCPMWLGDVTPALRAIQDSGMSGIVHLCGDEAQSRLEMAQKLAMALGVPSQRVLPISLDDLGIQPTRPKNTSMSNGRLRSIWDAEMLDMATYTQAVALNYRLRS